MYWVPGSTGELQHCGWYTRPMAASDRPASARITPLSRSKASTRSASGVAGTRFTEGGGNEESP